MVQKDYRQIPLPAARPCLAGRRALGREIADSQHFYESHVLNAWIVVLVVAVNPPAFNEIFFSSS
jgi:hypothetical protein